MATDEKVPVEGEWPVDPQQDVPIDKGRIWVDGCFDFSHHGKRSDPRNHGFISD